MIHTLLVQRSVKAYSNGLFHFISIHPPRKSINYVGGVNNGQKLMCPRGASSNHKLCPRGSWANHIRCPGESGMEKIMC